MSLERTTKNVMTLSTKSLVPPVLPQQTIHSTSIPRPNRSSKNTPFSPTTLNQDSKTDWRTMSTNTVYNWNRVAYGPITTVNLSIMALKEHSTGSHNIYHHWSHLSTTLWKCILPTWKGRCLEQGTMNFSVIWKDMQCYINAGFRKLLNRKTVYSVNALQTETIPPVSFSENVVNLRFQDIKQLQKRKKSTQETSSSKKWKQILKSENVKDWPFFFTFKRLPLFFY